jgi:hypothetical protein
MRDIFIPISFDCSVAGKLKNLKKRNNSYCFDWNIKTLNSIYMIIEDDFKDLFNKEYLVYGNKSYNHKYDNNDNMFINLIPVFNTKYNIIFVHDFTDKNIDNYTHTYEKYKRRINRFIETIRDNNNNIIFVYEEIIDNYIKNICNYWIDFFDDKNIFDNLLTKNNMELNNLKDLIIKKYLNNNINIIEFNSL